jgi:carbon monoxide dehydrogenase subunit G
MKLEQSFDVDAPLEQVWDLLIDVQRVAPCLPGAQLTEAGDDGTYNGTFSVKIGPATAAYRGTLKMEEVDEAGHRVTMRATGTDKRGQGGAKALMVSALSAREGGGTHVEVETDMTITGRLASFSRGGMIQDVSNRLLGEFAACLQSKLTTQEAAPGEAGAAAASAAGEAASAPRPTAAQSTPPPAQAKPISGLRLLIGVLRDRLRRLFRRASS